MQLVETPHSIFHYLLLLLFLSAVTVLQPVNAEIPVINTSPICARTGGTAVMSCSRAYAIYDVFVGRDTEGACSWNETTTLDCSVDRTESDALLDAVNIVYNLSQSCQFQTEDCRINLPPVETSCGETAVIRVSYFCFTENIIISNGGELTDRTGCGIFSDTEDIFNCPESFHKVNILHLEFSYLTATTNCSAPIAQCGIATTTSSEWLYIQENCQDFQSCPLSALVSASNVLYGCTDFSLSDLTDFTYIYSYICQYPQMFQLPSNVLPVNDTCIGMSNGLHAVVWYGRFVDNLCWMRYTDCQGENRQDVLECDADHGFDENSQQCQKLASKFCSVDVPVLIATSISSTQINASWTIDDTPEYFILTIDDPNYAEIGQLENVNDYLFVDLIPNTRYNFSISAVKQRFQSEAFQASNVTYPENPTGTITDITITSAVINYAFVYTASSVIINVDDRQFRLNSIDDVNSRFFQVSNLTGGAKYEVTIALEGMTGLLSLEPFVIEFQALPMPPENLTTSDVTETSVLFSWDQQGLSTFWRISLDGGSKIAVTTNFSTFSDLEPGTMYQFAVSNVVDLLESDVVSIEDSTIPHEAFFNVPFSASHDSVDVTWGHNVGFYQSFLVQLFGDSSDAVVNVTTSDLQTTYSGLECGTNYTVGITVESYGKHSVQVNQPFTTRPVAPLALNVADFGTDFLNLTWDLFTCSSSYFLEQNSANENDAANLTYDSPTQAVDLTNLIPGETYDFEIKSTVVDFEGNLLYSDANPRVTTAIQTLIPLPPVNAVVTDYGTRSLSVTWEAPSGVYTGFLLSKDSTDSVETTSLTTSLDNLTPGSVHVVRLQTFSKGADSTQNSSIVELTQRLKPDPPVDFTLIERTNINANISFSPPLEGEYSGFMVKAVSSNGSVIFDKNVTAVPDQNDYLEFIDGNALVFGDQINVSIFSLSQEEVSETALEGTVLLHPADPVQFAISEYAQTTLNVTWGVPPGLYGGHTLKLNRIDESGGVEQVVSLDETVSEHNFDNLVPGAQYNLELCVYSKFDSSLLSLSCSELNQMLQPVPPFDLQVIPIDKNTVNFTWDQEGRFSGYEVSYLDKTEVINKRFLIITGLVPANNYTFTVVTRVSDGTTVVESDSRSTIGWPYPDDITPLNSTASTASNGDVTASIEWGLPLGNHSLFKFNFTTVPNSDQQVLTQSFELSTVRDATTNLFNEQFTTTEIDWLAPGLQVLVEGVAVYIDLESQVVVNDTFFIPPVPPVLEYVVDSRTTDSVEMKWTFNIDKAVAEFFIFEYSPAPQNPQFAAEVTQMNFTTFSEVIPSLTPGQLYDYRVRSAVNTGQLLSDWSNVVTEATFPEVPQNPTVENLTLIWSPPVGVAEHYIINASDSLTFSTSVTTNETSLSLGDVSQYVPGRLYSFNIFSVSNNLTSLDSATFDFVLPPNNVNFSGVVPISSTSCTLDWQVPAGDVEKYIITVVPLSGSRDSVTTYTVDVQGKDTNSQIISNLTPGAEYKFEIVAYSLGKISEIPGVITARKNPLLTSIDVSGLTTVSAQCQWESSGIVDEFVVSLLDEDGITEVQNVQLLSSINSYQFSDLTPGKSYSCQVVAVAGSARSSPLLKDFTLYPTMPMVTISYFGTYNLSANWSVADGTVFDSFEVRLDGCRDEEFVGVVNSGTLQLTWDSLTPGDVCRVRVRTISKDVYSLQSGEDSERLYPDTPTFGNLSATETSVFVTWSVVGTASEFNLNIKGDGIDRNVSLNGDVSSFNITGLSSTTEYTLTLDAISDTLVNWVPAVTVVNTTPRPVTNPTVTPISDTELFVQWVSSTTSTNARYLITRLPLDDTVDQTNVHQLSVAETEFRDTGLIPGTDYTYEIVVTYSGINSIPASASGYTYPAVPFNIITDNLKNTETGLVWDFTPNYEIFLIQVSGVNNSYQTQTFQSAESNLFVDGLEPGEEYRVRIESKYKELYSQGFAEFFFRTGCYPIGTDHSTPWIIAFWLTFVYAVLVTLLCLFLAYVVYDRLPPKMKEPPPPAKKYVITATPLDGTEWQKRYGEFRVRNQ